MTCESRRDPTDDNRRRPSESRERLDEPASPKPCQPPTKCGFASFSGVATAAPTYPF
jgi:hypothetical protein